MLGTRKNTVKHTTFDAKKIESSRFRFVVWFANDETSIFGSPPLPHGVCDHRDGTQVSPGGVPTFGGLHVAAQYGWKPECPTGEPPSHVPKWQGLVGQVPITRGAEHT